MSHHVNVFRLSTLCAGLLCLGATAASAQNAAVPSADQAFMHKAAIGGMAEVQMGTLAQQKAANEQVKQFGARMVQDHTKSNDELKQLASTKGVQLPTAVDQKNQDMMERMQKLSGPAFDKAYMSHMVDDHKQDIADYKKESSGGKDADVKGFATKTLPILQQHMQLAEQTNTAAKTASK